jgi:peptidoglycan/xylan/chitin deacetylase (PgdA/CDA1 family)
MPLGFTGRRRPGDLVILGYHRVGVGDGEIDMPTSMFRRHLDLLAGGGQVRSLDDALEGEGSVVITFDDGTRDFYEHALPLLVDRGLPSVLYLATSMAEEDPAPAGAGISWPMVRDSVATGLVTVGSHTHGHVNLARMTEEAAADEMRRSKELIEDRVGIDCRHFAYPWGKTSPGADRAGRRLFDTAALDGWRTNRRGSIDRHRLGRTPILRSDGVTFFRAKVLGMLDSERYLYRALRRGPWGEP